QKQRAELLFDRFPKIHKAYKLSMHLRSIFEQDITKSVANLKLARWYNDVEESGFKSFQTIMNTFTYFSDKITNYFNSRATNAYAESFNSRIKDFRREFRGVTDLKFFLFRISKVFG
ncbi:transposase, partial [Flammeovirga aprica]